MLSDVKLITLSPTQLCSAETCTWLSGVSLVQDLVEFPQAIKQPTCTCPVLKGNLDKKRVVSVLFFY